MTNVNRCVRNIGIIISVTLVLVGAFCLLPSSKMEEGTSDSVILSSSGVSDYVKDVYSSKSNVKVTAGSETKLNSKNYNQNSFKKYYNDNNGSLADIGSGGICWAAATTSLLEYNDCEDESIKELSYQVLRIARNNGYWSVDSTGISMSHVDNLVTKMFNYYDQDKTGNNDYYNIYDTLTDEVDDDKVVLFAIKDHLMTGCGYVTYDVKYTKKNILGKSVTKYAEEDFVIVNDTWSNTRQYSYFPEREIGTGLSRWNFGICKVKD